MIAEYVRVSMGLGEIGSLVLVSFVAGAVAATINRRRR